MSIEIIVSIVVLGLLAGTIQFINIYVTPIAPQTIYVPLMLAFFLKLILYVIHRK